MENFEEEDTQSPKIITNMDACIEEILKVSADQIDDNIKPLDILGYCTKNQIIGFFHEECLGYTEENQMVINYKTFDTVCRSVIQRVQNVAIAQLAADGYLDCAWDDDLNDMVFWLSDTNPNKPAGGS